MLVFHVFFAVGLCIPEKTRYERQEKLNSNCFSYNKYKYFPIIEKGSVRLKVKLPNSRIRFGIMTERVCPKHKKQ